MERKEDLFKECREKFIPTYKVSMTTNIMLLNIYIYIRSNLTSNIVADKAERLDNTDSKS